MAASSVVFPLLGALTRAIVGSEKRRAVQYQSANSSAKYRSSEAVEAVLTRKGVETSSPEVREALVALNFDPTVPAFGGDVESTKEGAVESTKEGADAVVKVEEGPGDVVHAPNADSDFEPPSQRSRGGSAFARSTSSKSSSSPGSDVLSSCDTPIVEKKTKAAGGKRAKPEDDKGKASTVEGDAVEGNDEEEPQWKKRNRAVAQSRAAAFARGTGFKDDAGRDSQKPAKQAKRAKKQHDEDEGNADDDRSDAVEENASGTEAGKESWPGPWSTASDLYRKRDAAAQKRKQGPAVESAPTVVWVPMAMLQPRKTPPKAVPSLQDICLDFLATHIEACLESGLGGILPEMKAKLCQELCRRRKLLPEVLPIFTEVGDTSVLHLPDCSYLGEKDLAQAVERIKGPNLDEFSLKYCGRGMSDKLIEDLCQECPNITVLALGGCYRVTDKGIAAAVTHLSKLRVLELSSCTRISSEAIKSLQAVADTLESLSLKNSSQLKDTDLQELSALKNLKRLDLSGCYGVSDDVLMTIAKACGSTLEDIDVSHTPDSGFTQEPLECRVTEVGLQILATECKKLRKVALRCCGTVTDSGIEQLVAGCRYLTSIDLAKCKSLTDAGVSALAKGCPHLEWLSLDAASKDELPDDEEGAIEHKYGITDHSILEIEKYNGRTLTHLDVSWCRGITDEALGYLADRCPELRKMLLRGCSQITDVFLDGHSNQNLEVFGRRLRDSTLTARKRIHTIG